jgi:hypothetical protein
VSTQPVRDWIRTGQLKRDGPRLRISKTELRRFVAKLDKEAEPYDWQLHTCRFLSRADRLPWRFGKLYRAKFAWPKSEDTLTPKEIASRIGCHPSLIVKAINNGIVRGDRRTRCRWEIKRRIWINDVSFNAF